MTTLTTATAAIAVDFMYTVYICSIGFSDLCAGSAVAVCNLGRKYSYTHFCHIYRIAVYTLGCIAYRHSAIISSIFGEKIWSISFIDGSIDIYPQLDLLTAKKRVRDKNIQSRKYVIESLFSSSTL